MGKHAASRMMLALMRRVRGCRLQEVKLVSAREGLGAALDTELAVDVAQMLLDGVVPDDQLGGDRLVGQARGQQC